MTFFESHIVGFFIRLSAIVDKIVWQNVFCFLISHHMRTCLLYIKFSARSFLPLHQCCYFLTKSWCKKRVLPANNIDIGGRGIE